MHDFPIWEPGIRREYPPLRGAEQADVAIVGGGLTGVCCAAVLAAMGVKVIVLEGRQLGLGASWNCTGKVTCQLAGVYRTIADTAGIGAAAAYAHMMQQSVAGIDEMCRRTGIPLQKNSVYVFAETIEDLPALEKLFRLQQQLHLPVHQAPDAGGCPFPVEQALVTPGQLLVTPLPYLLTLANFALEQGCIIHEHSPVRRLAGRRLITPEGSVEAESIILATGSPIGCTCLSRLTMMQQRTCATLVLESDTPLLNSHLSVQGDELTLRPFTGGCLLAWDLGRSGSRTYDARDVILHRTVRALLPDMRIRESYIRQDVWSCDGLPLIGPIAPDRSHVLMATGYSGWGLCGSFLAAKVLAGYICGKPLPHADLLRPDRPAPHLPEGLRTAGAYLQGLAHPGAPTCPHMGGKLHYNPLAQRWECPCHGSAFDPLGINLAGPAATPATVSARQR